MGGAKYTGAEDLDNKIVIVTGANTGIGRETVLELAKHNAKVIMACRDMKKCEKVFMSTLIHENICDKNFYTCISYTGKIYSCSFLSLQIIL